MSTTRLGFPTALNQIGLKYEEVEKRLKEGKEPFDDEEAVKNRCEEKLKSLIETKNRILEAKRLSDAAQKTVKEKDLGTAPKVAVKPPWKRSYPNTTLEKLREKTRE